MNKPTRDQVYCWVTLCPLFDAVGSLYREDGRQPLRSIAAGAQLAWHHLHNNRFYNWLYGPLVPVQSVNTEQAANDEE